MIEKLIKDIKRIEQVTIAFIKTCENEKEKREAYQKFQNKHVELLNTYHPNLRHYIK